MLILHLGRNKSAFDFTAAQIGIIFNTAKEPSLVTASHWVNCVQKYDSVNIYAVDTVDIFF